MKLSRLVLATALCLSAAHLSAHEFWIEPQEFQVETGAEMAIDLKNGENFLGTRLSYFESQFSRFELAQGDRQTPTKGRSGDSPALTTSVDKDGLLVILHETTPNTLRYKEWAKFAKFAAHKDFTNAEADHMAAGWPRENFKESYTRHVKALMAVGSGKGADQNYGMATEFVALTNPYAPDFDGNMRVQVFFENAPRTNVQIEIFERAPDETVAITLLRTDANGIANVPVKPDHTYLLDAVVLRPHTADDSAVWQTLWAALTFQVPK
jgi:cobalt/nickel transport protein